MAFVEGAMVMATVLSIVWVGDNGLKVFCLGSLPLSCTLSRKSCLFLGFDLKHLAFFKNNSIIIHYKSNYNFIHNCVNYTIYFPHFY